MRTFSCCAVCTFAILALPAIWPGQLPAATRTERLAESKELVSEALHNGIYGRTSQRLQMLQQAAIRSPGYEPAYWHRGMVKSGNQWSTPEQVTTDKRFVRYEAMRAAQPDSVAGQLRLSAWCRGMNLADQQRAHLMRVIELDPQNTIARQELGFQRTASGWKTRDEIAAAAASRRKDLADMQKWSGAIANIASGLRAKSLKRRQSAIDQLNQIDDPSAAIAIATLARGSEPVAVIAINKLQHMRTPVAARELARIAVLANAARVREAAGKALKPFDRHAYAPALLSAMYTPVTARSIVTFNGVQEVFEQEGRNSRSQLVMHGDRFGREMDIQSGQDQQRAMQMAASNQRIALMNARIATALNNATGQERADQPAQWWQWWNEVNEVFVPDEKPVNTRHMQNQWTRFGNAVRTEAWRRQREDSALARQADALARSQRWQQGQATQSAARVQIFRRRDCLAAGTMIWTIMGMKAVETLRTGDMVLSQNIETGELAYKVVLKTTTRPTSQLVKIHAGSEVLQASGGHPFWIDGEGWVKARDIRSGMQMHTAGSVRTISKVAAGEEAVSYNLIVDGFHTYFAGKSKLLSHDNTPRRPTAKLVPGLVE